MTFNIKKTTVIITVPGRKGGQYIITLKDISEARFSTRLAKGVEFDMIWVEDYIKNKNIDFRKGVFWTFKNIDTVNCRSMGKIKINGLNFENVRQVCAHCFISGTWDLSTVDEIRFNEACFDYNTNVLFNHRAKVINLSDSVHLKGEYDFSEVGYLDLSNADLRNVKKIKTNPSGEVSCMLPYKGGGKLSFKVDHYDMEPFRKFLLAKFQREGDWLYVQNQCVR